MGIPVWVNQVAGPFGRLERG